MKRKIACYNINEGTFSPKKAAEAKTQTLMSAAVTKWHFMPAPNTLWRHFYKGNKGKLCLSNAEKFLEMEHFDTEISFDLIELLTAIALLTFWQTC